MNKHTHKIRVFLSDWQLDCYKRKTKLDAALNYLSLIVHLAEMSTASRHSKSEKAAIKALTQRVLKHPEIAKTVRKGRSTITKYIVSLPKLQLLQKLRWSVILCEANLRKLVWHAGSLQQSVAVIHKKPKRKISVRRIQQYFQNHPMLPMSSFVVAHNYNRINCM